MNPFTRHPASVGETYWQHFVFAFSFGMQCAKAAFYAIFHAFFPFLFTKDASAVILGLADKLDTARSKQST